MSYRNPKIIVPPNYGEIFAKNMSYGAGMVSRALQPILSAVEKQKQTKARMAASTAQYQQNIRNLVTSKSGNFEPMFEEHLQQNADAWYENEKNYANGKIDAKEYNTFKNNLIQEIYDAAGASQNLNEVLTYINTNKNFLSSRNDHEIFGLAEAIENPDKMNFQITRNEKGNTILQYKDEEGNNIDFDYAKLNSIKTNSILLKNDYSFNGAMGKKLSQLGKLGVANANQYKIKEDVTMPLKNNKARIIPMETLTGRGKEALINDTRQISVGNNVFTDKELEAHFMDEMHGQNAEYETRVAQTAAIMAKKHNVADEIDLYKKLLNGFKKNQFVKLNDGSEKSVSQIAYDAAEEDLILRSLKSTGLKPFFEGKTKIQVGAAKDIDVKPEKIDKDAIEDYNKKIGLFETVNTGIFAGLESDILIPQINRNPLIAEKTKYNINILSDDALMKVHEFAKDYLGMEIEQNTAKEIEEGASIFAKYGAEKPYYSLSLNKRTVGAKIDPAAKTEFKLTNETTLFDLISYRLNFEGVKISGEALQDIYEKNNNNPAKFQKEIADLFGISISVKDRLDPGNFN